MMMYNFQKELASSYRADLLDFIEQARQGRLAPSWQEYCFEEVEGTKGTLKYPDDGDQLFRQLRAILAAVPQISERESEAASLASFGGRLLFFFYLDRYTVMELAQQPNGDYDSFAFISAEKHGAALEETAAAMKASLDAWLSACGLPYGAAAAADRPNPAELCRSASLEEAVTFLYTGLKFPGSILC